MKKYLLLVVGEQKGRLTELLPRLKEFNFAVAQITRADSAMAFVRSAPQLSMVALDESVTSEECAAFVKEARSLQPGLPILWARKDKSERAGDITPDAVLTAPFSPEDVQLHATRLLREHFYPKHVIDELGRRVKDVLATSFATPVEASEPYLKGTRALSGAVSSLIYFAGKSVAGHLLVSAEENHLAVIKKRLLPTERSVSRDQAGDLAGELCNRILGAFKAYFEGRGVPFDIGVPVMLLGPNIVMRRLAGSPSLVMPIEETAGRIYVEFCFDSFDPRLLSMSELSGPAAEPGELRFL